MNKLNQILSAALAVQAVLLVGMKMSNQPVVSKSVSFFPTLEPEKVDKLEIVGATPQKDGPAQSTILLSKINGKWGMGNADDFPADGKKIDELLKTLQKLSSRTVVLQKATYHSKLEVAADKFQRKVTLSQAGKDTVFYVGSSPSFKNVHFRLDGQDDVYLVNELATTDLADRASNWVERAYLKYGPEQLWSLKIKNKSDAFDLEKNPVNGEWAALGMNEPLQKSTVDDLVRKAGTVNLDTPVGKALKPEYGLDQPQAVIEMVTGSSTIAGMPPKTTQLVKLAIGNKLDKESQYYAKASSSDYVVRVPAWGLDPLVNKGKKDLIEKPAQPANDPKAPAKPSAKPVPKPVAKPAGK